MAMLKYVKREVRPSCKPSVLSQQDIEAAQNSIAEAVNTAAKNSYSKDQHAKIGKYAAENGATRAAKHYAAAWGIPINESTARRFILQYLEKLHEDSQKASTSGEAIVITELETKPRGRLLLLREELDTLVQEFVNNLGAASGVVNTTIVMGGAEGIVSYRDISKLSSHGGHIEITKSCAKSLLQRMGFVKRKCSTLGKIPVTRFDELKEIFLADVAAEALINDIPESLIINWDQTGLSIVPTGGCEKSQY